MMKTPHNRYPFQFTPSVAGFFNTDNDFIGILFSMVEDFLIGAWRGDEKKMLSGIFLPVPLLPYERGGVVNMGTEHVQPFSVMLIAAYLNRKTIPIWKLQNQILDEYQHRLEALLLTGLMSKVDDMEKRQLAEILKSIMSSLSYLSEFQDTDNPAPLTNIILNKILSDVSTDAEKKYYRLLINIEAKLLYEMLAKKGSQSLAIYRAVDDYAMSLYRWYCLCDDSCQSQWEIVNTEYSDQYVRDILCPLEEGSTLQRRKYPVNRAKSLLWANMTILLKSLQRIEPDFCFQSVASAIYQEAKTAACITPDQENHLTFYMEDNALY